MNRENKIPDAEIMFKDKVFEINEDIVFDGTRSSDPDGDKLSFAWDFGDGDSSTREIITKSYNTTGKYTVKLTVKDENGFEDSASKTIIVGTPPKPVIVFPKEGTTFAVNDDHFVLFGYATDAAGNSLSDEHLTWEVRQVHSTHYHPFLIETVGNEIRIPPAPSPEDFHASTNSYLKILLTATDSDGLTSTTTRDIMPKTKKLYFNTDPPGLELILDGFTLKTPDDGPLEVLSWINHNLVIDVEDQGEMVFDRWNNGISSRHSEGKVDDIFGDSVNTAIFSKLNSSTAFPVEADVPVVSLTPIEGGEEAEETHGPIGENEKDQVSETTTETSTKEETADEERETINEDECNSICK